MNRISVSTNGSFNIYNEWFDDLDGWITHLTTNPMTVVYELNTPTFEPLPTADQLALNSLSTFDGVTHITLDSEIEPSIEVEYGTSKVGGYTLQGLLAPELHKSVSDINTTLGDISAILDVINGEGV